MKQSFLHPQKTINYIHICNLRLLHEQCKDLRIKLNINFEYYYNNLPVSLYLVIY